jgi:transketolase
MRLLRGAVPIVLDPSYRFEIGKALHLRQGKDFGIVSTGFMSERALDAGEKLAKRGISVAILHVPTIKPFDAEAVTSFAASVDHIIAAENHVSVGGLASLVVETLYEAGISKKVTRIGLPDRYIECGAVPTLQARYGLTTDAIVATIAALQ